MTPTVLPARMAAKVAIAESGCWHWTGALNSRGYGCISIDAKVRLSHRVAYELTVGAIPPGLQLDHLCTIKSCCNPDHLEPVTGAENLRRARGQVGLTVCGRNHLLTRANTYRTSRGVNECRICRRKQCADRRARLSGMAAAS